MKKLLILLLIGVIAAFGVYKYVFKASTDYSTCKPDVETSFSKVNEYFNANDNTALTAMADKIVSISGTIAKAELSDTSGTIILGDTTTSNTITCQLDKRHLKDIVAKTGDAVKIKGLCNGFMLDDLGLGSDLQLKGCSVVK
jgi:uncharacterized protein YdeI (BOF family)